MMCLEFFLVSEVLSSVFPHEEEGGRNEGGRASPDTLSLFYTISISLVKSILKPRKGTQGQPLSPPETINKVISELAQVISEFNR